MASSGVDTAVPQLVDAALADPAGMRPQLQSRLADDPAAPAEVRWALGVALRELDDLAGARRALAAGAEQAADEGRPDVAAAITSSLALVLLRLGDTPAALQATEAAAAHLKGIAAARNHMQRGLVLQRLGRHEQALEAYSQALPGLQRAGDAVAEARLRGNRGVLLVYLDEHDRARADLERAVELAERTGQEANRAGFLHNLGFLAGRQGDVPRALSLLDRAEEAIRAVGASGHLAVLEADRAEILADAGLVEEAVDRAAAAVSTLEATGDVTSLAEAWLLQARMQLLAGRTEAARATASKAEERFAADRRHGWQLQARYVATVASLDAGQDLAFRDVASVAEALAAGGWAAEARAARVAGAQRALQTGDVDAASQLLGALNQVSDRAPALARVQHWHATALLRALTGRRAAARRAVRAGLEMLHKSRLLFGSAELRAHAATHGAGLVELAVRMALEDGRPAEALRALDRLRSTDAGAWQPPPEDPVLSTDLAVLRGLDEAEREAVREGMGRQELRVRRRHLEQRIRDRARAVGVAANDDQPELDLAVLRRDLGDRCLVSYCQLDGALHALVVDRRRTRHLALGDAAEVRREIGFLRAALRRLAYGQGAPAALQAAAASLHHGTSRLEALVGLDRLRDAAVGGLVVVPSRALDGLPWGLFAPGLAGPPVVAPSAQSWLTANRQRGHRGRLLVATGPDLPGADVEVAAIRELRPDATVLRGAEAQAGTVRSALAATDTAHLVAHGRFRTDNPLFSSLRFADGPLTVYDLESLAAVPSLVVLSACEAGTLRSVAGDAVLGLGAALLRQGVRNLVAPVVEIPDEQTPALMRDFHAALAAGADVGDALAAAVGDDGPDSPRADAVRHAFVLFGAGT